MRRILAAIAFTGCVLSKAPPAANAQLKPGLTSSSLSDDLHALPPAPQGRSTIMGGQIRNLDPVRDQFLLKTFGKPPIRILFDERTRVFRDGVRISLHDLGPENYASVQTVLDGTSIFAVSIHMLSQTPEGECQGQVQSFSVENHELTVASSLSSELVKLFVPANTSIVRQGQPAFASVPSGPSDLIKGSLISVEFKPDREGRAVASHIAVLAVPGADFVFSGDISLLDLHSGSLIVVDPRDDKSYHIHFDATRIASAEKLHLGEHARITAVYMDGRYVATDIKVY